MSDQQAPHEDKPEPLADNPAEGTGTTQEQQTQAEIDWQRQYQNLQPEYTRATQEAAQLRQERELYQRMLNGDREAAELLGYELPDDTNDDEPQFIDQQARQEAAELKAWRESLEQQAQQYSAHESAIAHINEQFPAIEKQLGRELTDQEAQVIGDLAMGNRDENGFPMVEPAAELVLGLLNAERERRPRPRAPHFSPNGAEATKAPNLDNRQERQDWMASQLMANEQ